MPHKIELIKQQGKEKINGEINNSLKQWAEYKNPKHKFDIYLISSYCIINAKHYLPKKALNALYLNILFNLKINFTKKIIFSNKNIFLKQNLTLSLLQKLLP
ncbi:hypothetical protein PPERSA_02209 [Pseudocohnilembus persalinus]|uniref:Uncharacterized protein n=1 Tax=Pseudocohnilembus persalinus TaxID=266149 RepID=A0A0V0Q7P9_PSEPJ|nr:hypothetical protein PPERSA_02209 [Pseudocohnilembus persalinus]|eukprot:KRW98265.1 hypothetical protein PPERSA_02209 [Pseudocohnilembus persalinus]